MNKDLNFDPFDKQSVIYRMKHNASDFEYVSEELQKDEEVILAAAFWWGGADSYVLTFGFKSCIEKLLEKDPSFFQYIPTKFFDKQLKKEMKSFIEAIKTGLKKRVSGKPTDEDLSFAQEILTKTTEKIAKEKENIKNHAKKEKADKKAQKRFERKIDKGFNL